jgi:hypothetical protein
MSDDDKRLLIETLSEMRELKGQLTELKEHIMSRLARLEKKETEQTKNLFSALSLFISMLALGVSIVVNFFKHGGGFGR